MQIESVCSERPPLEEMERQTARCARLSDAWCCSVLACAGLESRTTTVCLFVGEAEESAESHEKHVELWKEWGWGSRQCLPVAANNAWRCSPHNQVDGSVVAALCCLSLYFLLGLSALPALELTMVEFPPCCSGAVVWVPPCPLTCRGTVVCVRLVPPLVARVGPSTAIPLPSQGWRPWPLELVRRQVFKRVSQHMTVLAGFGQWCGTWWRMIG